MKNLKRMCISVLGIMLIAACGNDNNQNQKVDATNEYIAEVNSANASRDSIEQLFAKTLQEIDSSVDYVFNKKSSKEHPSYSKATMLSREDILKNIKTASSILSKNRQKISQLKADLKKMKIGTAELTKRLEESDKKMKDYEEQLTKLKDEILNKDMQIADLHHNVDKLKFESIMNKEFATKFEDDLNTAYYTEGTYKELKKSGVLAKKGGILGIGSTETLNQHFPEQLFAKIDIRTTKSIPINARKAKLITEHPDSSYVLKDSAGIVSSLEIKNPAEFWKISKHMVLVVTNK